MRNQARQLQQFESNAELLTAFENISLTGEIQNKNSKEMERAHKKARAGKKETAGKEKETRGGID